MAKPRAPVLGRPFPPAGIGEHQDGLITDFIPAPEVAQWVQTQILATDGAIHNPDHAHLIDASLRYLWAATGFKSKQKTVVGQAEEVAFRCNAWQKGRQEQQMREWFGEVPDFLITLDASYASQCSDTDWCALVEHELYHVAQQRDEFGAPAFSKEGAPKLGIAGHDVEEFVGVVRRYGVGNPDGALAKLARAAAEQPQVSGTRISGACGTCLLKVA